MSLDNQVTSIKDMLFREMENSKNVVFNGLLNNVSLNHIPESLFVRYFLPCFLGNSTSPNWVMEWISIAGSPVADVAVVADGTKNVLFTVPSVLNTNNLFLNKTEGDLGDIFGKFDQMNNNLPTVGLNFLVKALHSKNAELIKKISFSDVNTRWVAILQRYNIISNISSDTSNGSSSSSIDDMFDF